MAALSLTNPDRLVYPNMGVIKRDVVEFYRKVARYIVPHLKQHPVTLKRYPAQTSGEFFWEKDAPAFTPSWVKTFAVERRGGAGKIHYIVIDSARTLEWAATVGTLEIHPFLARVPNIECPAYVVFDLDPGEGLKIIASARVALLLREMLRRLSLESFAKVSGSKGVQVYLPLNTSTTYGVTQPFAKAVAELLHREHPKLVVAEMAKSERKGRVFVDWSQNSDYKTTVSVYSLRAKRHRPHVSMPVTWEELAEAVQADDSSRLYWLHEAALERLSEVGDLFAPVLRLKQTLPQEFTRELSRDAKTVRARQSSGRSSAPRASEQGGRRTFQLAREGSRFVLTLNLHESRHVWQLETKPAGDAKQSVAATRLPDATSSTRNTNAEEVGTFELIEGDFEKGYAYLYFSGKSMQGDYTLARAGDANEWSLTRGFVAWGAVSDAARKTERGGTNARTSKSKSRVPSASPDFHVPSSERSSTFRVRRAKENHADGDRTARQEVLGVRKIAPSFIAPMECKLVERVPESDAWQYEVKLDGYRAIAVRHGSGATFYSRYGNELNSRFPQLARALRDCDLPECVLDGEIVALDAEGKPSFQELQNVKSSDRPIVYYVFDLLNLDGRDLTSLPLRKRRERLEQFESELCDPLRLSAAVHGDPTALLAVVREKGLEGVVAKRLDARYESGKRSGRWVKYRARPREEFVIGGYLPGKHFLDAALVGCFEGKKLVFVKKLRNGFVPHTREQVFRAIEHLKTSKCPFANLPEPPDRRGAVTADKMKEFVWVRPQVWCEVEFAEWTAGGRLRHAAFRELLVKRAGHGR